MKASSYEQEASSIRPYATIYARGSLAQIFCQIYKYLTNQIGQMIKLKEHYMATEKFHHCVRTWDSKQRTQWTFCFSTLSIRKKAL